MHPEGEVNYISQDKPFTLTTVFEEVDRSRTPVSWHFILHVRFSYLGLLRMRASILHYFSHAEQQYLMYLHYCKGRFRVVVGVHINKT